MSISDLSGKALGSIPAWMRFVVLGFALAGSYYKFDNAIAEHDRRMDAHWGREGAIGSAQPDMKEAWQRMDRIDARLDYLSSRIDRLESRTDVIQSLQTERGPIIRELSERSDDMEHRLRALEARKVPSKGPL